MFLIKKKEKASSLDITLKNLLSYLLSKREQLISKLSSDYTKEEKYHLIYNCALNTIDEYIYTHKNYIGIIFSTQSIIHLFKENFMLKQFERNYLSISLLQPTKDIIQKFDTLNLELNNVEKNTIMKDISNTFAST